MTGKRRTARPGIPLLLTLLAGGAPSGFGGGFTSRPAATRELLLPYLVFLHPLPEAAELLARGAARLTVSVSESNSFAGTTAFRSLASPVPGARVEVDRALVDQFRQDHPDADLFFTDGEVLWTDLGFRLGVNEWLEVGVDLPLVRYTGGVLDPSIEGFHDTLGLPDDGRNDFERGAFHLALFLGGSDLFVEGTPSDFGVGDLTLTAKIPLFRGPDGAPAVAGAAYLKLPTGSEARLLGSGSLDFGAQILFSRRKGRHAYHLSGGAVRLGDWDLVPQIDPEFLWLGSGTYEVLATGMTSVLVQAGITASPFRKATTEDLADPSVRLKAGFRRHFPSGLALEALIEENLARTNASIDFGIHFALAYGFGESPAGTQAARGGPGRRPRE
ncbi:MAG: DUF3187 family protein [Acidobacteria bacterium]|nr:DUF3187 family protein [Acidobacteriota bacterium]